MTRARPNNTRWSQLPRKELQITIAKKRNLTRIFIGPPLGILCVVRHPNPTVRFQLLDAKIKYTRFGITPYFVRQRFRIPTSREPAENGHRSGHPNRVTRVRNAAAAVCDAKLRICRISVAQYMLVTKLIESNRCLSQKARLVGITITNRILIQMLKSARMRCVMHDWLYVFICRHLT